MRPSGYWVVQGRQVPYPQCEERLGLQVWPFSTMVQLLPKPPCFHGPQRSPLQSRGAVASGWEC
jgi:hypothetical protein